MVISVASQKGGTGKTSTSISLAAGLAHKGKRVLLIDIDSQANSSKVLLHEYPKVAKEQTIYATILERAGRWSSTKPMFPIYRWFRPTSCCPTPISS